MEMFKLGKKKSPRKKDAKNASSKKQGSRMSNKTPDGSGAEHESEPGEETPEQVAYETLQKRVYSEQQAKYHLDLLLAGKNLVSDKQTNLVFGKALLTLELAMAKMGLQAVFNHISYQYGRVKAKNAMVEDITIKLLYRCLLVIQNQQKVVKIVRLIKQKEELMFKIQERQMADPGDVRKEEVHERRKQIIKYWLLGSRLYSLIMSFLQESVHFKKFFYGRKDMAKELRKDIMNIQIEDLNQLNSKLPFIDGQGCLKLQEVGNKSSTVLEGSIEELESEEEDDNSENEFKAIESESMDANHLPDYDYYRPRRVSFKDSVVSSDSRANCSIAATHSKYKQKINTKPKHRAPSQLVEGHRGGSPRTSYYTSYDGGTEEHGDSSYDD